MIPLSPKVEEAIESSVRTIMRDGVDPMGVLTEPERREHADGIRMLLRADVELATREALEAAAIAASTTPIKAIRPWGLQMEVREAIAQRIRALMEPERRTEEEAKGCK